ncbi:TIGR04086 family membrane protein [Alicyclobacillus sp. SO9]|uniref:TIGR04086 family membrane protein n=1 Tax=Alicyclobacillus sp. SO9 TaxID=2665646 RepID=UPI0018E84C1B|nr:TIGR04086 family membrane protein [Alicyclobacillus sp. SO9]QQE77457.1 TIGR04086 family membrane protein [Alicyclobacillus sp. SO9]
MNQASREPAAIMNTIRRWPLLYGLAWSLFYAVIGTIFIGIWAHYSNLYPSTVIVSIYVVHGIAIFIGSLTASRHSGVRGWFYGGITALMYCAVMVVIGFVVYNTFMLDAPGLLRICILTLVGAFSGMIGVNTSHN